jgi:NIMA (never in mitosis gene a)-related kinase
MEFCEQGDMAQLIKRCKKIQEYIPEEMAWKILAQMTLALFECHRGKILHRDLKPGNVFIDG